MPNEDSRTQGDRNRASNTTRRNLRSRRATSQRPTQQAPSATMSEPRRSSLGNRQYMFIDQDAARSTSNEAIRVHVMRESHRARRQLRGLMQNTETHGQMTIFSSAPPSPRPVRQPTRDRLEGQRSPDQSPLTENEEDRTQQETQTMDNQELRRLAQTRLTAVLTTTSPQVSAATPGFQFLGGLPPNIVDLCEDDAGALHALLALVTSVQTSVSTLQTAEYESSALEILRARLAESSRADHSDETIITVLLLSRLEVSLLSLAMISGLTCTIALAHERRDSRLPRSSTAPHDSRSWWLRFVDVLQQSTGRVAAKLQSGQGGSNHVILRPELGLRHKSRNLHHMAIRVRMSACNGRKHTPTFDAGRISRSRTLSSAVDV